MNGIDYGRLRSLTARELVRALLQEGFFLARQRVVTIGITMLMAGG
jgi:hypothetical protein